MILLRLALVVVAAVLAQDVEESMSIVSAAVLELTKRYRRLFTSHTLSSTWPTDMIDHWGYDVESHDVVTDDGYILSMLRIPHGRLSADNSSCQRPPILLIHGLMADASEFVVNPPESSPGMILADAGFDVFMLNVRGTTYSQRHLNLTKDDGEFWMFTMDDMAKYDAPAAIDAALALNGASELYLIGHSQGTLISFLLLSELPTYNGKVRAAFELAPAGTLHWIRGGGRLLFRLIDSLKGVFNVYERLLGSHKLGLHNPRLLTVAGRFMCQPFMNFEFCRDVLSLVFGPPAKAFNYSRVPLYLSNFFISTSTWNLLQYAQHLYRNAVYHFDVSPEENMRRYGQTTAPPYNYSNIDTDVYLFWSRNDWATSPEEIEQWLIPQMRPGVIKASSECCGLDTFEIAEYNHIDFSLATDCGESIFSKIISIVRANEEEACLT